MSALRASYADDTQDGQTPPRLRLVTIQVADPSQPITRSEIMREGRLIREYDQIDDVMTFVEQEASQWW